MKTKKAKNSSREFTDNTKEGDLRLENYNQFLEEVYSKKIKFSEILGERGFKQFDDFKKNKELRKKFLDLLTEKLKITVQEQMNNNLNFFIFYFGLGGKKRITIKEIAAHKNITEDEIKNEIREVLSFLKTEEGKDILERSILLSARETRAPLNPF